MKKIVRQYWLFLLIMIFDLVVLAVRPASGQKIFHYTLSNFVQMLEVIPPIFVLLGLLDVWVPKEVLMRYLGPRSGTGGWLLSMTLGAVAAGPLYGAFPVAAVMAKKGASYFNILTFIGAWSTLKIPMFLFETAALGSKFAVTRALVDIIGVTLLAYIIQRLMPKSEIEAFYVRSSAAGQSDKA